MGRVMTVASLRQAGWAAIPLRLIVGFGFIVHGVAKVQHGPDNFNALLAAIGTPAPQFFGWATILVELVGGTAVLVGAFIPFVTLPMAAVLLVAIFTVHLPYGFSSVKLQAITPSGAKFGPPGYEVDVLYLVCMAAILIVGSGPFAVDTYRVQRSRKALKSARGQSKGVKAR